MVLRDDGVPLGAEHSVEAVADDGRTQVTDVHLLGDVGGRVVDDDPLRLLDLGNTDVGVGDEVGGDAGQHVGTQAQVDESRTSNVRGLAQILDIELRDDVGGNVARWTSFLLGQPQGDIGLEVPELWLRGGTQLGIGTGDGLDPGSKLRRKRRHDGILSRCPATFTVVGQQRHAIWVENWADVTVGEQMRPTSRCPP